MKYTALPLTASCATTNSWAGFLQGAVIQRVLPAGIAQRAVHIVHINVGAVLHIVEQAHVFPAKGVFAVEFIVAALLPCQIGRGVGTSRRDAHAAVEPEPVVRMLGDLLSGEIFDRLIALQQDQRPPEKA